MAYKFYIRMDGQLFGPYSAREAMELELLDDIMVTEDSINEWMPACHFDFKELAKGEILERIQSMFQTVESTIKQIDPIEEKKQKLRERLAAMPISTQNVESVQEFSDLQSKPIVHSPLSNDSLQFPSEITYAANLNEGINSIGGKIIITPELLIFRAHSINLGDLSDRIFNIRDIVGYRKGILSFMYISFADGREIKLTVWKKQEIINELEARKNCCK